MGTWVEERLPDGSPVYNPHAKPENYWTAIPAAITDATAHEVKAAPAAGLRLYVTSIVVTISNATATLVTLRDGSTDIWRAYIAATSGRVNISLPIPLRLTAATALNAICAPTGSSIYLSIQGYTAAV